MLQSDKQHVNAVWTAAPCTAVSVADWLALGCAACPDRNPSAPLLDVATLGLASLTRQPVPDFEGWQSIRVSNWTLQLCRRRSTASRHSLSHPAVSSSFPSMGAPQLSQLLR